MYRERNFKFIFHVPAKIERKKTFGGGIVGHKGSAKLPVSKMIRKYGVGWGREAEDANIRPVPEALQLAQTGPWVKAA